MIRHYSNKRIYKILKVVKILSIIAIVLSLLGLSFDIIIIINRDYDIDLFRFLLFHFYSLSTPFLQFSTSQRTYKRQSTSRQTELNNDFSNLISAIIISLIPVALFLWFTLSGNNELMYLPNILIYISDGFLINSCVLIKREWKKSPPAFVKDRQLKKELIKQKRTLNYNQKRYQNLIEKCGIKFFIKYYKQIKRLPLRDVTVSENYSSIEREERLLAAKKIIDLGISEFTLTEILKTYSNILDEDEIAQAKSLLAEMQS